VCCTQMVHCTRTHNIILINHEQLWYLVCLIYTHARAHAYARICCYKMTRTHTHTHKNAQDSTLFVHERRSHTRAYSHTHTHTHTHAYTRRILPSFYMKDNQPTHRCSGGNTFIYEYVNCLFSCTWYLYRQYIFFVHIFVSE